MSGKNIGISGPRDERSVRDRQLQAEFAGHKEFYKHHVSGVGILGSGGEKRSVRDRQLQAEFSKLKESYRGRNCPCGCRSESECNCADCPYRLKLRNFTTEKCPCGMQCTTIPNPMCFCKKCPKENYKGFASTRDNPNNPMNSKARYVPLR